MGGRGSFKNVDCGDFSFVKEGKLYNTLEIIYGLKIIKKIRSGPLAAPIYSHHKFDKYVVIEANKIKHIIFFDETHKQHKIIDFGHKHGLNKISPHVHFNLIHKKDEMAIEPNKKDKRLISRITRKLKEKGNIN
ncbi:hypothetical protein [Mycoplasmopsis opalescens]|uniref:hypothetical protein n=1 Tax=Mycoplasmopsis opalescens TaxID=114886 RepID=UPI0004A70AC2|nr:hypothetical protein [Mycoplasmopsis opalescens]